MAGIASPVADDMLEADNKLLTANANPAAAVWFMHPRDFGTLRKQREGGATGGYLIQSDLTAAGRYVLLGHPIALSTQMPINLGAGTNESIILLVDMSQVVVAVGAEPQVTVLDQLYGNWDQQALRVVQRMDIAALNGAAIVKLTGVTP
jgi:HK97 family phage major capsid protein